MSEERWSHAKKKGSFTHLAESEEESTGQADDGILSLYEKMLFKGKKEYLPREKSERVIKTRENF